MRALLTTVAVLVALLGASGFMLKTTLEKKGQLESRVDDYASTIDALNNSIADRDAAAITREHARQRTEAQLRQVKRQLNEALSNEPDCKIWGDGMLPDCIRRLLPEPASDQRATSTTGTIAADK